MKTIKYFFITLLISLTTIFEVYPTMVFAENSEVSVPMGNSNFLIMFIVLIISVIIVAFIAYIAGEIVNRR